MVALMAVLTASTWLCPCAEPPRSADVHDCCATAPGFRAASDDCCSEPGDAPLVVSVPSVHLEDGVMACGATLARPQPLAAAARRAASPVPSPPSVLRI